MREERGHRRAGAADAAAGAIGVVDRLEESVFAEQPVGGEPAKILRAARRIDHHRERRRVRRDDQLVAEAALQAEAGHAEGLVLIVAGAIDREVRRLRDAPRRAARHAVVDLPPHRHAARLVEQRLRKVPHQQQRHQVLEHRRAPRQQHRRAAHAGDQAAEVEPVLLGHVALGDRDEAGQPRFGREQVVERRIEPRAAELIGEAVADREELPLPVVEEAEMHFVEVGGGAIGERSIIAPPAARPASSSACAVGQLAAAPPTASAARRRSCRCRPSTRTSAAAASGSACRTS